jgi:glycosyltransferase involved in cell wall biosynthesis
LNLLTAIILTYNEEIHIERCLQSLLLVADRVVVVDSFSTDNTVEIAKSFGAKVFQRKWKNYSEQFAWGMSQCDPDTKWLMRIDADEYLESDLRQEIPGLLDSACQDLMGIYIKRKIFFHGKWIKHGGCYPQVLLRIWRNGSGTIEQRWMDEHIVVPPGAKTITARGGWVDDNHKGISFWINKHNSYASRETVDLLNIKYHFLEYDKTLLESNNSQAKRKRFIKEKIYSKLPAGFRAFLYFCFRYFIQLGFLDGQEGFIWHFMQGFWYRLLVDIKVNEVEKSCNGDIEKITKTISNLYGLKF